MLGIVLRLESAQRATIFQDITDSEDAKTRYRFSIASVAQEVQESISDRTDSYRSGNVIGLFPYPTSMSQSHCRRFRISPGSHPNSGAFFQMIMQLAHGHHSNLADSEVPCAGRPSLVSA